VLADLSFETGSSRLSAGPFPALDELAAYMAANPGRSVTLVGHTDASGALEPNVALSRARARAVRERLIADYGIAAGRIAADGVGYLMPLAPNVTEEGRALNRRVEAVVTSTE
jgi:OOP family OmpA-OmpF porin